jgi:hypothetical protein
VGCGDVRADCHRGPDRRAGGALLHQRRPESSGGSDPVGQRQPEPLPESHAFAIAQREADQEPDTVSGQDSDPLARRQPERISGRDPVSGYDPDSVTDREPDSFADSVALAGQLPEQPVAVRLDDICQRHRDLPVGRAAGAHSHLDDV